MNRFRPIRYAQAHWQGKQGFGWSFWVNLVALRLLISFGQALVFSDPGVELSDHRLALIALGLFAHGAVLIWQVVGVLRASEHHIRDLGSMSNIWGGFAGVLVAFWLALSDLWGVWIATLPMPEGENFVERMDREHASRYELVTKGDTLLLQGDIALGLTKAVGNLLADNPAITTLRLASAGGNIYEARGLAKLVRSYRLATVVGESCTSSCTVVFIGGQPRRLEAGAKLGFHQYQIAAEYQVPLADPAAEQARDLALFRQARVADWFLERMFQAAPGAMWFPSREELISAGVITSP